ncbi:MAG: phosphoribosylformylglycinamidine synthase, partial [Oscillospiraceae bacterium]
MAVFRVFVEKKSQFATVAKGCFTDLQTSLQIKNLKGVRVICRYDVENITNEDFKSVYHTVFSEPQVDNISEEMFQISENDKIFATEFLPGQFDQRADSCAQCIQLATTKEKPVVKSATIYVLEGSLTDEEFIKIKEYLINPVESREASFNKPETLKAEYEIPTTVET